jgi:hypothetical protein
VTALLLGTLLSIAALAFVLAPLFGESRATAETEPPLAADDAGSGQTAIEALREIEFDRATGKLSEADYAALKAAYTERAVAAMRESDREAAGPLATGPAAAPAGAAQDAALEALIRRYRGAGYACPDHGPRRETDAVYCSECGRYLAGACEACGAAVGEPGARFCSGCGRRLAA